MSAEIDEVGGTELVVDEIQTRPRGVTFIAVFLFVYAGFLCCLLMIGVLRPQALRSLDWRRNSEIAWELAYLTPLRIGMAIVLGAGLWKLKRWARKGLIFLAGATMLGRTSVFIVPVTRRSELTYAQEFEIAACILLIGYLVNAKVSLAFEVGSQSDE